MKKTIFFIIFSFLFIPCVNASTCSENPEYIKWIQLPDEERNKIVEPTHEIYTLDETEISELANTNTQKILMTSNGLLTASKTDSKYDARDYNLVTPVENQLKLPNCWIHSGNSVLETAALLNGFDSYNFSEKHVVTNMAYKIGNLWTNEYGYNTTTNDGGFGIMYASYLFNHIGPIFESDYYYSYFDERDYNNLSKTTMPNKKALLDVDEYFEYNSTNGCTTNKIDLIKELVLSYGSVSTSLYSNGTLSSYYVTTDKNKVSNHAVTIIGWDDTIPASKFNGATRNGAFLIKNSWGNSGLNGYNYISYDDVNICDSVYTLSGVHLNEYDNTYSTSKELYPYVLASTTNTIAYSVKFNTNTAKEYLSKISFYSLGDVTTSVYYSKNSSSDYSNLLGSKHTSTSGITSIIFKEKLVEGEFYLNFKLDYDSSISNYLIPLTCKSSDVSDLTSTIESISIGKYYISSDGIKFSDLKYNTFNLESGAILSECRPNIYAYTKASSNKANSSIRITSTSPGNMEITSAGTIKINLETYNIIDNNLVNVSIISSNTDYTKLFEIKKDIDNNLIEIKPNGAPNGIFRVRVSYGNSYYDLSISINDDLEIASKVYEIKNNAIKVSPVRDGTITVDTFINNIDNLGLNYHIYNSNGNEITGNSLITTGTTIKNNDIEYKIIIPGDINKDGEVDAIDLLWLKQVLIGIRSFDELNTQAADLKITEDNELDAIDLLYLKQYLISLRNI